VDVEGEWLIEELPRDGASNSGTTLVAIAVCFSVVTPPGLPRRAEMKDGIAAGQAGSSSAPWERGVVTSWAFSFSKKGKPFTVSCKPDKGTQDENAHGVSVFEQGSSVAFYFVVCLFGGCRAAAPVDFTRTT